MVGTGAGLTGHLSLGASCLLLSTVKPSPENDMFQRAKPERAVHGFSFKWKEHWILAFAMALWLLRVGRQGQHLKYFEFWGFFYNFKMEFRGRRGGRGRVPESIELSP